MTPTPLKISRSMSIASDNSETSATSVAFEMCMEDASSVNSSTASLSVQSPPRSARRTSNRLTRSANPVGNRFPHTPKSRRLFDDVAANSSKQRQLFTSRPMLQPLDLNHDLQDLFSSASDKSFDETSSFKNIDNSGSSPDESFITTNSNSTTTTKNTSATQGRDTYSRKRTSAERREIRTPKMNPSEFGYYGTNMGTQYMHISPHISPNSFLTMDGRYVQSKNPFSSPMMMEDESFFAGDSCSFAGVPGPALPVSFSDGRNILPGLLPPRLRHHDGYPQGRFSFTGSPIQEDDQLQLRQQQRPVDTGDTASATCASLHKVRRFNHSDDVVAATGQQLSGSRSRLSVDTSASTFKGYKRDENTNFNEDLSPTDVINFPPPPTPAKSRRPIATGGMYQPATPRGKRQQIRSLALMNSTTSDPVDPNTAVGTVCAYRGISNAMGCRTPHPASLLHHEDEVSAMLPKSRFYSDFDIIGQLGKGSFGTVYKVLSRLDGCMYAIKEAQRKAKGVADRDRMLKEVYALAALSDQADTATFHIVRYHQAWMEDDRLYIQTELCTGTLADECLAAAGHLTERRTFKIMREILLALEFLHRQQMVHLDIKPENIFLKNDQYKLGDFGLVTRATCQEDVEEGDSRYMSKELLTGDHSDLTKSDIFSLGATVYEICLGRALPMNGQEWQDMRAGILLPLPNASHELFELIHHMMDPDASHRPSASELLKHPQLLSDEQKALIEEKTKVVQANLQLAEAQQHHRAAAAAAAAAATHYLNQQNNQSENRFGSNSGWRKRPPSLPLRRANTWDGRTMQL